MARRVSAVLAAMALVMLGAGAGPAAADSGGSVHRSDAMRTMPGGARIDTSYFTAGDSGKKRPAVLLTHGFGGSKADVRPQAEKLARHGYAVLTWSARSFGKSTGKIGLNDPKGEVADVSHLIDWLATRPEVRLDSKGDPRVGVTGASYGGAVSLLAAGYDKRVDAIAPQITYWNLADALFPNNVFKKLWAGIFFTSGSADIGARPSATGIGCGRFEKKLCDMYQRVAVKGKPDAAARELLEERSPSAVGDRIKVPTFIAQGQTDSLFPLGQADAMAKRIKANGAPVDVDWIAGGHDGGDMEVDRVSERVTHWFDRYLKKDTSVDTGPAFRVSRTGGVDSTDGAARLRGADGSSYPGLTGTAPGRADRGTGGDGEGTGARRSKAPGQEGRADTDSAGQGDRSDAGDGSGEQAFRLPRSTETFSNPPGGAPPAISSVPGVGGAAQLANAGLGLSIDFPGQFARFETKPLTKGLRVTGTPTTRVRVSSTTGEAVLFAKVYDVSADGKQQTLPSQLVSPVRVDGAKQGKDVDITLPAVDHQVQKGHRLRLVLSATDLGYASPAEPATYTVTPVTALHVPTAPGVTTAAASLPSWVWMLPAAAAVVALALLVVARRRTAAPPADPDLAEVPLRITGLSKRYARSADRYAVRDLSFEVGKGQVLGLLGPNGAGKTTTLRMLMGLITPDAGEIRVFGHAIRPGAPVLSRVGSFVEGAGFLPHLTGRANLDLYWQATGRPAEDAHIEEALEIAGLGDALGRAVRTYSQGMRQRLAIAQAMLGLPDLLILDEPTNGLDPPQIREMREVMIRYAEGGRTVIVSSHLLAEVEQSCTHLVVMDRGQLVQAGPVAEIIGSGDTVFVGLATDTPDVLADRTGELPGVASAVATDGGLLLRLDGITTQELLPELVKLDLPVTSVGPHRRLEDAFLHLIGADA
ncbi:ABC transporter ATP-binding protein [Streptomyces tsukubensis]|uniref:ABC transporter ATP-binding protein n=1 Tax=Streptomyces tsukubensis TaxID=83656 RepID=A0A1V4A210_9ACTN|nr:ABC transporter ATP-binding protein [Streptomyces tsukubensis]